MVKKIEVVLASNNAGKIRELNTLLAPINFHLIPQAELGVTDAEENGLTFIENALIKARHASRITGLPAIADDSGLAVKALQGAPGIHSARYAGNIRDPQLHNNKLLQALADIPEEARQACFHCVLVYLTHAEDPTPIVCHGRWQGMILPEARGSHGFGYDPVFYVPSEKCSAAELTPERKNMLSHRRQALNSLLKQLSDTL